jgi:hypothetical protein
MIGDYALEFFEVNDILVDFVCQEIEDIKCLESQFTKIPGIKFLEGVVTLRATKDHTFGTGRADQVQVNSGQLFEFSLITTPKGVMTATSFLIAQNRLHTACVQDS